MITWIMFLGVFLALPYMQNQRKYFHFIDPFTFYMGRKSVPSTSWRTYLVFWDIIIIPEDDLWLLGHVGCFRKLIEKGPIFDRKHCVIIKQ